MCLSRYSQKFPPFYSAPSNPVKYRHNFTNLEDFGMKKRITLGQITAFREHLVEEEREPDCHPLEGATGSKWLSAGDDQREDISGEQILCLSGMGGLPGEVPENTAQDVPQYRKGIDQG